MGNVWTSDDITFCLSDCDDMECERNSKHVHHREIPHIYADLEGDKRFCRKAQDDEKEYQPGVWYGADMEPPKNRACLLYSKYSKYSDCYYMDIAQYTAGAGWNIIAIADISPDKYKYILTHEPLEKRHILGWMIIPHVPHEEEEYGI